MKTSQEPESIQILELSHGKELASLLSSSTAQKIFEAIKEKPQQSASEISKKTTIPLSTVQYHLKALEKTKIITSKHFTYSQKGKKVPLFSPSQQAIIIVTSALSKSKLQYVKEVLPGLLTGCLLAGGALWGVLSSSIQKTQNSQDVVGIMKAEVTNSITTQSTTLASQWFPHSILGGAVLTIGVLSIIALSVWAWYALRKKLRLRKNDRLQKT